MEEGDANPTYEDLLHEASSCKSELTGAVREKARIVLITQHFQFLLAANVSHLAVQHLDLLWR